MSLPEPDAMITRKVNKDGRIFLGNEFSNHYIYYIVDPEFKWGGLDKKKRIPRIKEIQVGGTEVGVKTADDKGRVYIHKHLHKRWCTALVFKDITKSELNKLKQETR